ncbi:MAG: hypothetical protein R3A44_06905 [Caldilineaceae bacterium]
MNTPSPAPVLRAVDYIESPMGAWIAQVRTDLPENFEAQPESFYVEVVVKNREGSIVWTPIAERRPYGLGYLMPTIVQWSQNDHALYLSNSSSGDGCGIFGGSYGLWRFDAQTGQMSEVLTQTNQLAIAGDEEWVAYTGTEPRAIELLNLTSGATHTVKLEMMDGNAQLGALVWSPLNNAVALTVAHLPCTTGWTQSIVMINVETLQVTTLLDKDLRKPKTVAWLFGPQNIRVVDEQGRYWNLHIPTRAMTLLPAPDVYVTDKAEAAAVYPPLAGNTFTASTSSKAPRPIAHKIPSGLCPPYNIWQWIDYSCARQIEQIQFEQGLAGVERLQKTLSIATVGGTAQFIDQDNNHPFGSESYAYLGFLPSIGQHLVGVYFYEGAEFLLVNQQSGELTQLTAMPIVDDEKGRFIVQLLRPGYPDLTLQIWQSDLTSAKRLTLTKEIRIDYEKFGSGGAIQNIWWDDEGFQLTFRPGLFDVSEHIAVAFHENDSDITVTINGATAPRPALDVTKLPAPDDPIRAIDTATAGKRVYGDRDYIFTRVPNVLNGHFYLRFNNSNMHENAPAYAVFHLYRPATLYVAIDEQACELPGWLAQWTPVDDVVQTDDIGLKLYMRAFPEGDVALGGPEAPPAACIRSHYLLFVTPDDAEQNQGIRVISGSLSAAVKYAAIHSI